MSEISRRVVKDMALTGSDFERLLPKALQGWDYQINGTHVDVGTDDVGITITISPLPPRKLSGLFVLERSQVEIAFHGLDSAQQDGFLKQFDQAFQRGGG